MEIRIFKYLIYLFLIILAYKLSMSVAVSFGFFPEYQQNWLATIIFTPFFLFVFIPTFVVIVVILFLVQYFFFKSNFFKNFATNHTSLIFWIILGVIPYLTLPYFNFMIAKSRQQGYQNMKIYRQEVQNNNNKKYEAYKIKLLNYSREEALEAVKKDINNFKLLSDAFKKDKEIVYEAVKENPYEGLKYANDSFKNDRELMLMAVKKNAYTFCMAGKELRKDKVLAMSAINGKKDSRNVFSCMDKSLQKDREIVLSSIRKHPVITLRKTSNSFKKDRGIVLEAVGKSGFSLNYADTSLQKDREVVLVAVKQTGYALEYVDHSLKNDREIVLAALKTNGGALRFATDEQKADKEMVLTAVKHSHKSYEHPLQYADISLLDDKEIALASVKHDGFSLKQLSMRLKSDKEVVLLAIQQNKNAIVYASKNLQDELK